MIFISTYISLKSINVSLPIGTCLLCSSRAAGLHPRKRYASRCSIWDWKVCARESGRAHQLVQRPEPMSLASQKFEMQLWGNDTEEEGGYRRGYLYPRKKKLKIINACSVDTIFPVFNKHLPYGQSKRHWGQKISSKIILARYCFLSTLRLLSPSSLPYFTHRRLYYPVVIQDQSAKLRFLPGPSQILFTLPELRCS